MPRFNDYRAIDAGTPSYWAPGGTTGSSGHLADGMFCEVAGTVAYYPYDGFPWVCSFTAEAGKLYDLPFYSLHDDTTATIKAMYVL